jgi:DNA-binding NarL/FixJ family response regulator
VATAAEEISVLIVDDQWLVRSGFAVMLRTEPGIAVVGQAGAGEEAVALTRQLAPTVLLAIRMPNMDGLTAARLTLGETKSRAPIPTRFDSEKYVYAALRAGASGFLLKDAPSEQLVDAVRSVAAGDVLVDSLHACRECAITNLVAASQSASRIRRDGASRGAETARASPCAGPRPSRRLGPPARCVVPARGCDHRGRI